MFYLFGGLSGAASAVSTDSGVWTGGEGGAGEGSPRMRRRPRNLEMVMRNAHSFHLRELQVADLDIMGKYNIYMIPIKLVTHEHISVGVT